MATVKRKSKRVSALKCARNLLARPGGWGKRYYAKPLPNGRQQYCAEGAVREAARVVGLVSSAPLIRELEENIKGGNRLPGSLIRFNDKQSTRRADVLALFDRTIKTSSKSRAKR
jgi:hypothetical protein